MAFRLLWRHPTIHLKHLLVFDEIYNPVYYINEFDDEGNRKQAVDNMLKYCANNYYGLMTKTGIPVTTPQYTDIEGVTPGVYQCHIPETGECIMVNSTGVRINN